MFVENNKIICHFNSLSGTLTYIEKKKKSLIGFLLILYIQYMRVYLYNSEISNIRWQIYNVRNYHEIYLLFYFKNAIRNIIPNRARGIKMILSYSSNMLKVSKIYLRFDNIFKLIEFIFVFVFDLFLFYFFFH